MKQQLKLVKDTGETVVANLEVADGFWSRFRGLQFRRSLPVGSGVLLVPCSSIHTFFVRFAIDVVFIDRQGFVVAVRRNVKPWQMVFPVRGAHATLELPAGAVNLVLGDKLYVVADLSSSSMMPASLNFLSQT